jgi:hypothetical protein
MCARWCISLTRRRWGCWRKKPLRKEPHNLEGGEGEGSLQVSQLMQHHLSSGGDRKNPGQSIDIVLSCRTVAVSVSVPLKGGEDSGRGRAHANAVPQAYRARSQIPERETRATKKRTYAKVFLKRIRLPNGGRLIMHGALGSHGGPKNINVFYRGFTKKTLLCISYRLGESRGDW